jgi:uracil-DNA glycosylase
MLVKYSAVRSEIEEGVAFYGRSGTALMRAFKRLDIDPISVYGTLCVKCPTHKPDTAPQDCVERLLEEIAIVTPRIIVVMGAKALDVINRLHIPLAHALLPSPGKIQELTPSIDGLYVPDIDQAFDNDTAKRDFWNAFKTLGDWNKARLEI